MSKPADKPAVSKAALLDHLETLILRGLVPGEVTRPAPKEPRPDEQAEG